MLSIICVVALGWPLYSETDCDASWCSSDGSKMYQLCYEYQGRTSVKELPRSTTKSNEL